MKMNINSNVNEIFLFCFSIRNVEVLFFLRFLRLREIQLSCFKSHIQIQYFMIIYAFACCAFTDASCVVTDTPSVTFSSFSEIANHGKRF